MPDIFAQVRLNRPSGLPEDVIVNTLAFSGITGSTHAGMHSDLVPAITTFYEAWASYRKADFVSSAELRTYDRADAEPREPIISSLTLTGTSTGNPMPSEVACCLSFYADRNLPRQRGRIYLGPLTSSAMNISGDESRVDAGFMSAVLDAAKVFGEDVLSSGGDDAMNWSIYSRTDNIFRTISDLWMDNSFDTQRSRGLDASARATRVVDLA